MRYCCAYAVIQRGGQEAKEKDGSERELENSEYQITYAKSGEFKEISNTNAGHFQEFVRKMSMRFP